MSMHLHRAKRTTALKAWLAAVVISLAGIVGPQLLAESASASPVTLHAVADATVKSASPDANYGGAYSLAVKYPSDADPATVTSYVKFQVTGLSGAPAQVVLRINTYSANPGLQVWRADNSWTEAGVTFGNAPVMTSLVGAMPDVSNNAWTELDVSGVVTADGTYTFGVTTTRATTKTFGSRESGATGPQLFIEPDATPTPTPTSTGTTSSATPTSTTTSTATASGPTSTTTPTDPQVTNRYNVGADSYVRADQPDAGYGSAYTLFTAASDPEMRIYLRFIVTGLTGPVTSASLRLYSYSSSSEGIDVHSGGSDWTEAGLTWNNAPSYGTVVGSVKPISLDTTAVADVTPAVTGNGTYTFVLTTSRAKANKLASRESTANAPQLVVTSGAPSTATPTATDPTSPSSPATSTTSTTAQDPTLVAAGDIACPPDKTVTVTSCQQKATSDLAISLHPDLVLPLGDDQYELGASDEFTGGYAPTWGRMDAIARPIPGNHEYGYIGSSVTPTGGAGYFAYFGARSHPLQPDCTTFCTSWYSYDVGSWHLIALDSQCAVVHGCNPGNPEYQWLLNDLNTHANMCTLAYWHIPIFSSSQDHQPDMTSIFQLLYNKGADVVLNGHAHFYERFAPQDAAGNPDPAKGVREILVGTGGRNFFSIRPTPAANSEARIANTFGVLQMTLHPTSYDWRFVPVPGSTATDQGSSSCH